jgi:diguanylate cyclase (GGDEF)-like protein
MASPLSNSALAGRVAAFIFLPTLGANAASLSFINAGSWSMSHRFWIALAVAIATSVAAAAWRIRERTHRRRENVLELAVVERTQALDLERRRERERNQILEMLVSNQPLESVLDAVARLIREQCPDSLCAILMRRGDGYRIAAAPELPGEWLAALQVPHAVPFEVWSRRLEARQPALSPAWKILMGGLKGRIPEVIHSWPIGHDRGPLGALLLFYTEASGPGESDSRIAEEAGRMLRLAFEHSRLYDDLNFHAHHDNLTGLPNRMLFEERLDRSLCEAEVLGQKLAVLFIDLDCFKQVNDTLSHRVGDLLLCEIASRMKRTLRPGDTAARIGGDEFTIVLNNIADAAQAAEIAARVLESIRQPVIIEGQQIGATASAGIAIFPDDGKDSEQLQRAADAAMYHAKNLGSDRAEAFATRNDTLDRVRLDEELRLALSEGYFVVHYQPKVGADRRLVGFEALLRMNHPKHGLIPPASFIPVAEASGMIVPIGKWVLEEVCRQVAEWESRDLGQVRVAVNVSPVQICRPDFAESVHDCLTRYGIAAGNLELELTEGLLINAAGVAQEQLRDLRELGVQLSIDDFGTGYSSLSYLHRLQIDSIKLDRSFVQSIDTDKLACRLVQAMIGVAQGLGLTVVAEGVETEGQRDALIAAGCPFMQGFLFARPQPPAELEELLRFSALESARRTADPDPNDLLRLAASMLLTDQYSGQSMPA